MRWISREVRVGFTGPGGSYITRMDRVLRFRTVEWIAILEGVRHLQWSEWQDVPFVEEP